MASIPPVPQTTILAPHTPARSGHPKPDLARLRPPATQMSTGTPPMYRARPPGGGGAAVAWREARPPLGLGGSIGCDQRLGEARVARLHLRYSTGSDEGEYREQGQHCQCG